MPHHGGASSLAGVAFVFTKTEEAVITCGDAGCVGSAVRIADSGLIDIDDVGIVIHTDRIIVVITCGRQGGQNDGEEDQGAQHVVSLFLFVTSISNLRRTLQTLFSVATSETNGLLFRCMPLCTARRVSTPHAFVMENSSLVYPHQ